MDPLRKNFTPRLIFPEEPQDETEESEIFNDLLSNWIVGATFSLILIFFTYFSLLRFLKPKKNVQDFQISSPFSIRNSFSKPMSFDPSSPSSKQRIVKRKSEMIRGIENHNAGDMDTIHDDSELDDESNDEILPFSLCMISASVFAAELLLVPLTIISHQLLTTYTKNWYLQWLRRDLISHFWDAIFLLNIISLLVLLPFAHLYEEAVGFGQTNLGYRRRSLLGRLYETTLELLIFIILLCGIIYLLYCIVGEDDTNYLLFAYSLISSLGSILFLASTPLGFTSLTKWCFALKTPFISSETIEVRKEVISLQLDVVLRKLNAASLQEEERELLTKEWKELQEAKKEADKATVKGPFFWNSLSIVCTILNLFFPIIIVLRTFVFLAKELMWEQKLVDLSSVGAQSTLESMQFTVEALAVTYSMIAALIGFYQLSWMKRIRPRLGKTTVRRLTLNTGCVLILSSSFPIVFRILGLTSFDLIGFYSYANYVKNDQLRFIFRVAFMIAMTQRYFELFPPTRYAYNYLVNFTKGIFFWIGRWIQSGAEKLWLRKFGSQRDNR